MNDSSNRTESGTHGTNGPGDARTTVELTLAETLHFAVALLRDERLDDAEGVYRAILARLPEEPSALHFLGLLLHRRGDSEAGLALIRQSIALLPGVPGPLNNLGNVLMQMGRFDEAREAYQDSVALDPDDADLLSNIGALRRRLGDLGGAEASLRQALAIRDAHPLAWFNLSLVLIEQGRVPEGLKANARAISLSPDRRHERSVVIRSLLILGEIEGAIRLYREWLVEEPDNPVARHHLAACLGEGTPSRASDAYVVQVFDSFSASFDEKLSRLDYRAPERVAERLAEALGARQARLRIGDLGCGTGLCAPLIRGWAAQLTGCDLSPGMLSKAADRGGYDALVQGELVAFLRERPAAFDVLVSADTLCYFGDLAELARAAFGSLAPGGRLIFTLEALDDDPPAGAVPTIDVDGYRLHRHGRYAHRRDYADRLLKEAGFVDVDLRDVVLRMELGEPVQGWLAHAARRDVDA